MENEDKLIIDESRSKTNKIIASGFYKKKMYQKAVDHFEIAIKLNPNDLSLYESCFLANFYALNFKKALEYAKKIEKYETTPSVI